MNIPFLAPLRLIHTLVRLSRRRDFRSITVIVFTVLLVGTIFFRLVEGWNWLDSFYFCFITLTTIGYGDFTPSTDGGKIFTMLYILVGLGVLISYINVFADDLIEQHEEESLFPLSPRIWRSDGDDEEESSPS